MNRKALLFIGFALAMLAGLFLMFRPEPASAPAAVPPVRMAAVVPATPAPKIFEIKVSKGQRISGPAAIQVQAGDEVVLRLISDRADELHLHGYDLHLALAAGVPAELKFKAEHSGRFDYELHHAHAELGALEVLPQ